MRVVPVGALAALVLSAGACHSYRPTTIAPEPGTQVRILFTGAMTVTASLGDRTQEYAGVVEVDGTMQGATRDTVALRLAVLRTASRNLSPRKGEVAMLPTARIVSIDRRAFDGGKTVAESTVMFFALMMLSIASVLPASLR